MYTYFLLVGISGDDLPCFVKDSPDRMLRIFDGIFQGSVMKRYFQRNVYVGDESLHVSDVVFAHSVKSPCSCIFI